TSFSGCDIKAVVNMAGGSAKQIGNLSTISYSIHREKFPVRALGFTRAKGWTRGPRTIAGTLVFTIFDRYALYNIAQAKAVLDRGRGEAAYSLLGDQMTPFDIICMFTNEYGRSAQLRLIDIELVDEGQTMSVNDIYTESTHSFVAGDIDVMYPEELGPMTSKRPFLSEGVANSFRS
ncbi:MAG: hypothetical protein WC932_04925, partial [archaeon]